MNSNALKRRMVDAYSRRARIAHQRATTCFVNGEIELAIEYEEEANLEEERLRKWQKVLARASR